MSSPIDKFYQVVNRYPGNNKQWWVAKAAGDDDEKNIKAGDFLPDVLNKTLAATPRPLAATTS